MYGSVNRGGLDNSITSIQEDNNEDHPYKESNTTTNNNDTNIRSTSSHSDHENVIIISNDNSLSKIKQSSGTTSQPVINRQTSNGSKKTGVVPSSS